LIEYLAGKKKALTSACKGPLIIDPGFIVFIKRDTAACIINSGSVPNRLQPQNANKADLIIPARFIGKGDLSEKKICL
jgi:hypothetical protein